MREQTLILVDENDNFLEYAPRGDCHRGQGRRHRAFVTLIFDSQDRVLLQRRRHKLFDNFWDLTAISHPLHIDGRDESYQEASDRALKKEIGIGHVAIKKVGAFNYFARDGKNCENEYCAVLMGNYDGPFKSNKQEVYEAKKIGFNKFLADINSNPQKYTPWARIAVKKIQGTTLSFGQGSTLNFLQAELEKFLEVFEPYAKKYFAKKIKSTAKYSPIISKFYEDLADFSSRGKKMRAFLVWLGYRVGKFQISNFKFPISNELEKVLPICLAFEMTQSFLLIHDDIIDNSDLRRGKPTIHKIYERKHGGEYGRAMAIVLGDIACVELFDLVASSDFEPKLKILCVRKLINVLLETAYGQTIDIENAYIKPTLEGIHKVADLKSARYSFVGPLTIGAMLSGASSSQMGVIEEFGLNCGLAFQIQDDILGVFGDEKVLGKSTLSDMREGKNTILVYKTRELAKGEDKKVIDRTWGKRDASETDLTTVQKIIINSGALAWCRQKNQRLVKLAKKNIAKITNDRDLQRIFEEIADFVISRDK